jgi:proline dehydrogenase
MNHTVKAYRFINTNDLKKRKFMYTIFNKLSGRKFGHKIIEKFMDYRPPFIYPWFQATMLNIFSGGTSLQDPKFIKTVLNGKSVGVQPLLNYSDEYTTNIYDLNENFVEMCKMINFLDNNRSSNGKCGGAILRATGLVSWKEMKQFKYNIEQLDIERIENICNLGVEKNVPIVWDAETIDVEDVIHKLSINQMIKHNRKHFNMYATIQCYRKDTIPRLEYLIQLSRSEKFKLGIKLVRGAYLHNEEEAGNRHLLHDSKEKCNKDYNTAVKLCIENIDNVSVMVASHNPQTQLLLIKEIYINKLKYKHDNIISAQMLGMRNDITFNINDRVNTMQFIPYGNPDIIFPYLVRRGIENSTALSGAADEVKLIDEELEKRKINNIYV